MVARTAKGASLINGRRMRVTRLDSCGRVVFGDDSVGVTDSYVSVAYTANTDSSDDVLVRNANGDICVNRKGKTSLTGYGVEIEFCQVDPAQLSLMTGQPIILNAAGNAVVGFEVDTKIDMGDQGLALEVWAGADEGDACDTVGSQGSYGYLLLPFLQGGYLGDFTVENGAIDFTWSGANTVDGNSWGSGPYDVELVAGDPAPLSTPVSKTAAMRFMFVEVAPPTGYVGTRPLLDPGASDPEQLTSIAAAVAARVATFTPTPADLTVPFYYEFGDGTWDYIASTAMGATTHTYPAAGTYTARATIDGVVFRTVQVVVAA